MCVKSKYLFLLLFISINTTHCVLKNENISKGNQIDKLYPFEDHFLMKQYPETTFHINAYEKSMTAVNTFIQHASHRSSGEWVVQGPGNIGARANSVAVDYRNPNKIFVGYSDGGLFRTTNNGETWIPVFDDQLKLSIGDIAIDPVNSNIVYAGTGDPNVSGYPFFGDGIYQSTDGGDTWENKGLKETRVISQIRISGKDNKVIYVAAMGLPFEKNNHRGLYKSSDGGNTWQQILYVNDSTGICDLVIHPDNHDIIYAAAWNRIRNNKVSLVSGPDAKIYKSIDGGRNWKILSGGLPQDNSSRIGIDISQSNPEVLYACYTHPSNFNLKGVYRSNDGGENWFSLPIGPNTGLDPGVYGGFGWYFGKIRINPGNPDDVFLLGVDLHRSTNGGQSWQTAAPPWYTYTVHADKHDLIFNGNQMYLATDGGVYRSDINNVNWSDIENIPTTQFYRVGYNPNKTDHYYGGAQDNGTTGGNLTSINNWQRIYGGDGFQPVFHPSNPDFYYVETQNGGIAVTTNGGVSFQGATTGIASGDPRNWDMPLLMSYHNPDVLYTGTDKIYANRSGVNPSWVSISPVLTKPDSDIFRLNISAIHESPSNPDYLVAGTSDGSLWLTKNQGSTWEKISNGLPEKYISSVVFSPLDETSIYVSYTGYKDNDHTPYIYRSSDSGKSWSPIQGNLPQIAINNILVLPPDTDIIDQYIFIATDAGVFYSGNSGQTWQRLGSNMPFVTVYDIDYNQKNNQIIAGTFGRSIQTFDLYQIGYGLVDTKDISTSPKIELKNTIIADDGLLLINRNGYNNDAILFQIMDIKGNIITNGNIAETNTTINLINLKSGIYFFTYAGNVTSKMNTIKFVKI